MRVWWVGGVALAALALVSASESYNSRASRADVRQRSAHGGTQAIVVLGYGNPQRRINRINSFRVRVALRSIDPSARETYLVCCGGAVAGTVPEADFLAREARRQGFRGAILVDQTSRTTRENIEHAIPLLEDADVITIASHPAHARRARAELRRLAPQLAARLGRAKDYRFGEQLWDKLTSAALEVILARRMRSAP